MIRNTANYVMVIFSLMFLTSCDDPNFTIYDPLEKDFTIYAVLDNRLECCLLKIHQIYLDSLKMKPEGSIGTE